MTNEPIIRVFGADEPLFGIAGGAEYCLEEQALAILLADGIVFANHREYGWGGKVEGQTTVLFVNCGDVFAWGVADAEELPFDEIGVLLKLHLAESGFGVVKWVCLRRKQRPQAAYEGDMRQAGAWDSDMDALPPNVDDRAIHASFGYTDEQYAAWAAAKGARAL